LKQPKHFDFAYEITKEVYIRNSPKNWTLRYALKRWYDLPVGEYGRLIMHTRSILAVLKEQWGSL
jgi:hypothetical protein